MISPIGVTKASKGFSLIELSLVIIIIGIALALAVPNFSKGYDRFLLNNTADDLLRMSRWAQAMAIGQGRIYALFFSHGQHAYAIRRARTNEMDDQDSFEPVKGMIGHEHELALGIELDSGLNQIDFYPDGTIDPTKIQLKTSAQTIILSTAEVRGMMTKVNDE